MSFISPVSHDHAVVFEPLAPYGPLMARLRAVGEDLGLYDYWLAIADIDRQAVAEA